MNSDNWQTAFKTKSGIEPHQYFMWNSETTVGIRIVLPLLQMLFLACKYIFQYTTVSKILMNWL